MAIVIGDEDTRVIPVYAVMPDGKKDKEVIINATITVLDDDDWHEITERWDYLGRLAAQEKNALANGLDFEPMSEDERQEANSPVIYSVQHLIVDIDLDLVDGANQPIPDDEKVAVACKKLKWLRQPLFNAVIAVQNGMSNEKYRKLRAKN